jgi:hypothetical protein
LVEAGKIRACFEEDGLIRRVSARLSSFQRLGWIGPIAIHTLLEDRLVSTPRRHADYVHDGQFPHARNAKIARRANLSRRTISYFQKLT